MFFDEPGWPLVDDFFAGLAEGRSAATIRRYVRVHHRLMTFLVGEGLAPAEEQAVLAALPSFVRPEMLPEGTAEARMQLSIVTRLADHLAAATDQLAATPATTDQPAATPAITEDVITAVQVARAFVDVRAEQQDPGPQLMPARFLQQPGAQW